MSLQRTARWPISEASGGSIWDEKKRRSTPPSGADHAEWRPGGTAGLLLVRSSALQPVPQRQDAPTLVNHGLPGTGVPRFFSSKILESDINQTRPGRA